MRTRINILAVAIVLAILSFAYARYDYANKHSATLTNPFGKHESTTVTDPLENPRHITRPWYHGVKTNSGPGRSIERPT